jgi:DNA-binding MarR family transcriptional regulator
LTERTTANETIGPPLVGALLRMPWETVRQRMLEGLHARGFTDLHSAHLTVLQYPGPRNVRPLDLAVRTRMTKQAMNHLLGQMERLGYVARREDPEDQRYKRVDLTDRGEEAFRAIREIVREVEVEWEDRLGPQRFAQLCALLNELSATSDGAE